MTKNILIVEDSSSQALKLKLILEMNNYACQVVGSGEEALKVLEAENAFDMIISDVIMPGINGYELCKIVKRTMRELPIMLMTASTAHLELVQCVRSGADAFLTKPYELDILLSRIKFLLRELSEEELVALGFELTISDTHPIAESSIAQLTNLLVTTLEDVSRTNERLNAKSFELQEAQKLLMLNAELVEKELGTTRQQLEIRDQAIETLEQVILIVKTVEAGYMIVDSNSACEVVLGYRQDELINKVPPLSDNNNHGYLRFTELLTLAKAPDAPKTIRETIKVNHKDGTERWCDFHVSVISRNSERDTLFACTLADISYEYSAKLATEYLSQRTTTNGDYYSEVVLRIAEILNADTAFIARLKDSTVHTTALCESGGLVSNISYPLAGSPCDEVIGRGEFRVLESASESFPDFSYLAAHNIGSYIGVSITTSGGDILGHLAVMCRDSILRPDTCSEVLRIFAISVGAEIERLRAAKRYEILFEFAPDAMVITDGKGTLLLANKNAEKLFEYELDELLNKTLTEIFDPGAGRLNPKWLEEYRESPVATRLGPETGDLRCITKSGRKFPVEINLSPMKTDKGRAVAIAIRDITDQLKHEEDRLARHTAEEANMAKSAFLATMSHEIRTPINGVLGSAELLTQMSLGSEQMELVQTIHESGNALLHVIDEILDFSKIEAGKLTVEKDELNLTTICESVCRALSSLAKKKGVTLSLFIDPALPQTIISDSVRLRQILNNLISNALKFSVSENGTGAVKVRVESGANETFLVSVSDNGIGMSEEYQEKLFTPFTQAEASTTRRFGGTGLGLTICKRLTELLGGEISVNSKINHGTTFTVTLPLARVTSESSGAAEIVLNSLDCILLTDDEDSASDWALYLKDVGANVECFTEFEQANGRIESILTRRVVVMSSLGYQVSKRWFRDLRLSENVTLVILQCGHTRAPIRRVGPSILLLEYPILFRNDLLSAALIASGKVELPNESVESSQELISDTELPDRTTAIARGELILVTEDNVVNQTVIRKQLAILGYLGEVVDDGVKGLEAWLSGDYALLLTDLHMPKMDGYELARKIRATENSFNDRPIIALTANALKGEKERCINAGMNDYLSKPISLAGLKSKLEEWLQVEHSEESNTDVMKKDKVTLKLGKDPDTVSALLNYDELIELVGDEPEMLNKLSGEFKRTLEQDKVRMQTLDLEKNRAELADLAHRIKSSARMFGAHEFAAICEKIENVGRSDSEGLTKAQLKQFDNHAKRVLAELDDHLKQTAAME